MNMESSLVCDVDFQITCLQQILGLTESMKKQCIKLENEKNDALKKCEDLKDKLERLSNKKCTKCSFLTNELRKERKEKEKLKKEVKAKLFKTLARALENLDDGSANHMTQLFTELVCDRLNDSPEQENKKGFTLIEDSVTNKDDDGYNILVNETVMMNENAGGSTDLQEQAIVIPETEAMECFPPIIGRKEVCNNNGLRKLKLRTRDSSYSKENIVSPDEKGGAKQPSKKLRLSPILSSQKVSPPRDKSKLNQSIRSPSILSEIIEAAGGTSVPRPDDGFTSYDEKGVTWKMKPSALMEAGSTSATGGKKLKQMTLSLTRAEKKHDISLSENFNGGVVRPSDDDNDVILPSPEPYTKKTVNKRAAEGETMEDPDITLFNPAITSTCLPVAMPGPAETSFDRLPEIQKSPKYKYRRDTVRKRVDRMKLPGQDCDQCAKYYEAAGLDQTQEVRARLNQCSRHRDKYQIRANTPPGFWDPVIPTSSDDSQDH